MSPAYHTHDATKSEKCESTPTHDEAKSNKYVTVHSSSYGPLFGDDRSDEKDMDVEERGEEAQEQ